MPALVVALVALAGVVVIAVLVGVLVLDFIGGVVVDVLALGVAVFGGVVLGIGLVGVLVDVLVRSVGGLNGVGDLRFVDDPLVVLVLSLVALIRGDRVALVVRHPQDAGDCRNERSGGVPALG